MAPSETMDRGFTVLFTLTHNSTLILLICAVKVIWLNNKRESSIFALYTEHGIPKFIKNLQFEMS
jgi:hypothetical protein